VGALIGLGAAGEEGFELGAERGASAVEERGGVFSEEAALDVLAEIPRGLGSRLDPAGAPLGDPASRRNPA
jgi:hypothetical protein